MERIAALVHATPVTALHTARVLRTATDAEGKRRDLWPQPGSGARITSYTPTQMVNLLLALAAGEPIRGPEVVDEFRSLSAGETYWTSTRRTPHPSLLLQYPESPYSQTNIVRSPSRPLLWGKNLGEDLDEMVWVLANDAFSADLREALRSTRIFLTLAPRPAAMLVIPNPKPTSDEHSETTTLYGSEQPAAPSALVRLLAGSDGENAGALEALAAIWRENQEALRPPKKETAAIHPWQGTNAAALSQPPATERERGRRTPPILLARERALNSDAAGPPFTEERPDARHRQLPANGAGRRTAPAAAGRSRSELPDLVSRNSRRPDTGSARV